MHALRFVALETPLVEALQAGGTDANGQAPERHISDGDANPCRHCLEEIDAGETMLVFAHRPFPEHKPNAEIGPIFLHARACKRYAPGGDTLPVVLDSPDFIVRGYAHDDRIVYGTGKVTPTDEINCWAQTLLARDEIAYLHVRSARNNCYQCRIERV
ncbi:MAG: DUF1203 domain-containing protein [Rhodospirillaceae bacterium]|nr:DUF1203 domain-containing protein [Rhodospirillaceae bacterium]